MPRKSIRRKSPRRSLSKKSPKKRLPRSRKVYKPSKYIQQTVYSSNLKRRVNKNSVAGKKELSDFRKSEAKDMAWLNSL